MLALIRWSLWLRRLIEVIRVAADKIIEKFDLDAAMPARVLRGGWSETLAFLLLAWPHQLSWLPCPGHEQAGLKLH